MPRRNALRKLNPEDAAAVLLKCYVELAGEEALFRALLAEGDIDEEGAAFWIGVYQHLFTKRLHPIPAFAGTCLIG